MAPQVNAALTAVEPTLTVGFQMLDVQVNDSFKQERIVAMLSGFFAGVALRVRRARVVRRDRRRRCSSSGKGVIKADTDKRLAPRRIRQMGLAPGRGRHAPSHDGRFQGQSLRHGSHAPQARKSTRSEIHVRGPVASTGEVTARLDDRLKDCRLKATDTHLSRPTGPARCTRSTPQESQGR